MPEITKTSKDEFDSPTERLLASIAELRQKQTSKSAHSYRTSLRRFQAWNEVFSPTLPGGHKDSFKLLEKLRKATGKLRDSEVHLDLLKQLHSDHEAEEKKLRKELKARRSSYKRRLKELLRESDLRTLSSKLRKVGEQPTRTPESVNSEGSGSMWALALDEYRAFVRRRGKLTPENLHAYRLACKQFRYTAELAGENANAQELVNVWKGVQDVIGDWHDFLTLSEVAEKVLGDSTLHILLVQRTEEKYRESLRAVEQTESKLVGTAVIPKKEPRPSRAGRRAPAAVSA